MLRLQSRQATRCRAAIFRARAACRAGAEHVGLYTRAARSSLRQEERELHGRCKPEP